MFLPVVVVLLATSRLVSSAYDCLCFYSEYTPVFKYPSVNLSETIGLLNAFDCKAIYRTDGLDPSYLSIHLQGQVGYVVKDDLMKVQRCAGYPLTIDIVATKTATSSATTIVDATDEQMKANSTTTSTITTSTSSATSPTTEQPITRQPSMAALPSTNRRTQSTSVPDTTAPSATKAGFTEQTITRSTATTSSPPTTAGVTEQTVTRSTATTSSPPTTAGVTEQTVTRPTATTSPPRTNENVTTPYTSDCSKTFGHSCYIFRFGPHPKNWADAQKLCASHNSHLVFIESSDERDFLQRELDDYFRNHNIPSDEREVWIGLTDRPHEGHWHWTTPDGTRTSLHYTAWKHGQPDNSHEHGQDCGVIRSDFGYRWDDEECNKRFHYMCERQSEQILVPLVG